MKAKKNLSSRQLYFLIVSIVTSILWSQVLVYGETKPIILKMSHQFPPHSVLSQEATYWANLVEKRTEGRIKFKHFYSSSLVKPPQVFDALREDVADVGWGAISFITGKVPDVAILEFQDHAPIDKLVEVYEKITPTLTEIFANYDLQYIFCTYVGVQGYGATKKFLKSPDDFKGMKMRAAGRGIIRALELWGASPVFLDVGDVYTALQRGTIDGSNAVLSVWKALKIYEVCPYYTYCGWNLSNFIYIAMNSKKWNSISQKDQSIMLKAGHDAMLFSDEFGRKEETEIMKKTVIIKPA